LPRLNFTCRSAIANDEVGAFPAGGVTSVRALRGAGALVVDGATLGGAAVVGATGEAAAPAGTDDEPSSREHEAIPPLMIKATTINAPMRRLTPPLCRAGL
jgi:hypothetical protein